MEHQLLRQVFSERTKDVWIIAGLCISLLAAFGSAAYLWSYKSIPGVAATAPPLWPGGSHISRSAGLSTLIMFAHPMCVCTRASLTQMRIIMSQMSHRVDAYVVIEDVGLPLNASEMSDIQSAASSIPHVHLIADSNNGEKNMFGASTSGQTMLYDPAGQLVFSGGITGARGHEGANAGTSAIINHLNLLAGAQAHSPVFGCALDTPIVGDAK